MIMKNCKLGANVSVKASLRIQMHDFSLQFKAKYQMTRTSKKKKKIFSE